MYPDRTRSTRDTSTCTVMYHKNKYCKSIVARIYNRTTVSLMVCMVCTMTTDRPIDCCGALSSIAYVQWAGPNGEWLVESASALRFSVGSRSRVSITRMVLTAMDAARSRDRLSLYDSRSYSSLRVNLFVAVSKPHPRSQAPLVVSEPVLPLINGELQGCSWLHKYAARPSWTLHTLEVSSPVDLRLFILSDPPFRQALFNMLSYLTIAVYLAIASSVLAAPVGMGESYMLVQRSGAGQLCGTNVRALVDNASCEPKTNVYIQTAPENAAITTKPLNSVRGLSSQTVYVAQMCLPAGTRPDGAVRYVTARTEISPH